jgi:hypothetical protein
MFTEGTAIEGNFYAGSSVVIRAIREMSGQLSVGTIFGGIHNCRWQHAMNPTISVTVDSLIPASLDLP